MDRHNSIGNRYSRVESLEIRRKPFHCFQRLTCPSLCITWNLFFSLPHLNYPQRILPLSGKWTRFSIFPLHENRSTFEYSDALSAELISYSFKPTKVCYQVLWRITNDFICNLSQVTLTADCTCSIKIFFPSILIFILFAPASSRSWLLFEEFQCKTFL